jgi:hypothetical protein
LKSIVCFTPIRNCRFYLKIKPQPLRWELKDRRTLSSWFDSQHLVEQCCFPSTYLSFNSHISLHQLSGKRLRSMGTKKHNRSRPETLKTRTRHSFGGSHHNVQVQSPDETPYWPMMGPRMGLPVLEPSWYPPGQKRHLSWSHLPKPSRRSSSPLSTIATASAMSESQPPSMSTEETESKSTSTTSSCERVQRSYRHFPCCLLMCSIMKLNILAVTLSFTPYVRRKPQAHPKFMHF